MALKGKSKDQNHPSRRKTTQARKKNTRKNIVITDENKNIIYLSPTKAIIKISPIECSIIISIKLVLPQPADAKIPIL